MAASNALSHVALAKKRESAIIVRSTALTMVSVGIAGDSGPA